MTEIPGEPPALVRYMEGLKAHDVAVIAEAVRDDLAFVIPARTLDKREFLAMLRALYAAFPDWSYDHDPPEARGEVIAVLWRQGGTHTRALVLPGRDPIPATGRTVRIPDQRFFYRVRDGKIAEIRPDPVPGGAPEGIFAQIGLREPPRPGRA